MSNDKKEVVGTTDHHDNHGALPSLGAAFCSASTAAELYRLLEYYRNFMPFCVGMTEAEYAETQEAKTLMRDSTPTERKREQRQTLNPLSRTSL